MKTWEMMLARVAVIIGLYFAWFLAAQKLFFNYVYPRSAWFEQNTVTVIILNDIVGLPLMLLAWRFLFKENLFKAAKFRVMDGKSVAIALWIGLGAGLFTVAFSRLPVIASDKYKFVELFDYLNRAEWYVFLVFLILGNIYKETLFRGILMNEFRRVLPVWIAIVIQGVLYGALFFLGDIPLSLYGFLGAVIFALLYVWFKSIWAPIAAQIACQGSQYLLWHYGPETRDITVMSIVMAVAAAMIAVGIFLAVKHRSSITVPPYSEAVTPT